MNSIEQLEQMLPHWAHYRTVDADGSAKLFEKPPVFRDGIWNQMVSGDRWGWDWPRMVAPPKNAKKTLTIIKR